MISVHDELRKIEKLTKEIMHYHSLSHYASCLSRIERVRALFDLTATAIKKKEEDLNYLESLEVNDTKEFKQFQENQKVFNETGDKARVTFSILDSAKDLLRTGENFGDFLMFENISVQCRRLH